PCRIGPRSTPTYGALADAAIQSLGKGRKVFAGQRADGFYVDLGAVFDLLDLRPFQNLHLIPTAAADGRNTLAELNLPSIALQVPIKELTGGYAGGDPADPRSVIGVYTSASRRASTVQDKDGTSSHGPYKQVSRLANPLVNEAIIPMGRKDEWNRTEPRY